MFENRQPSRRDFLTLAAGAFAISAIPIARSRFPARTVQTRVRVTARLAAGSVRVAPEILGTAPAPTVIDLSGPP